MTDQELALVVSSLAKQLRVIADEVTVIRTKKELEKLSQKFAKTSFALLDLMKTQEQDYINTMNESLTTTKKESV